MYRNNPQKIRQQHLIENGGASCEGPQVLEQLKLSAESVIVVSMPQHAEIIQLSLSSAGRALTLGLEQDTLWATLELFLKT